MKNYSHFKRVVPLYLGILVFMVPKIGFSQFVILIPYKEKVEKIINADYKAWVRSTDNSNMLKGKLLSVEDDHNLLFQKKSESSKINLRMDEIQFIKFRKNGKIGRGIFTGAMIGIATGALIGYSAGDDEVCESWCFYPTFSREEKAIIGGLFLSVPGAIVGGLVSAFKVKIPMGADYKRNAENLKKFTMY